MRTFDFSPLRRSTVGFERLFDLINNTELPEIHENYPPYDIVRTGEETFRISLALAGFSVDQITVTAQQNRLTVAGRKGDAETSEFLYRSIATRPFERHFALADHVEVVTATFENGLLQIDLVRRVPEAMKLRRIEIGRTPAGAKDAKILPAAKAA